MHDEAGEGGAKMCWYCGTHVAHYIGHDDDRGDLDICACCHGERIDPDECAGQGPCSYCGTEY